MDPARPAIPCGLPGRFIITDSRVITQNQDEEDGIDVVSVKYVEEKGAANSITSSNICYLCIVNVNAMAKPIKNTPVLKGKDLIVFHQEMEKSERISVAEKKKERERVAKSAKRLMQSLTFLF